jgi:hypothetical protein
LIPQSANKVPQSTDKKPHYKNATPPRQPTQGGRDLAKMIVGIENENFKKRLPKAPPLLLLSCHFPLPRLLLQQIRGIGRLFGKEAETIGRAQGRSWKSQGGMGVYATRSDRDPRFEDWRCWGCCYRLQIIVR